MLARLDFAGGWTWSAWQADRGMAFNSYLFEREGGCVAVDPLPLDDASLDDVARLGGVQTIVLTNRDHERDAGSWRERFGARVVASAPEASSFTIPVDATFDYGAEVFAGAFAVALPNGKTPGEVALHLPAAKAAVVGDAVLGTPAGRLSLLPAEKLRDRVAFVLTLRRLWALQLDTLLLCDGQPIFGNADRAIGSLLEREGGPAVHRMNVDEVEYAVVRPGKYATGDGEVGLLLGARQLGYRVARIPPGQAFCPLHWHVRAEEFFYVIDGRPSIRTLDGTFQCRPGDFIAFPPREAGAHQVLNESDESCVVLMAGMEEAAVQLEACFYPDSDKVGMWTSEKRLRMLRASPDLNYYDGEG